MCSAHRRPEEGTGSHGTGAMDDCEPPDVGPGTELGFSTVSLALVLFLWDSISLRLRATALAKLDSQQAFGGLLSLFPISTGVLGLQMCVSASGFS